MSVLVTTPTIPFRPPQFFVLLTAPSPSFPLPGLFYSPPVAVLVISLIFVALVMVLHIWGKFTRG